MLFAEDSKGTTRERTPMINRKLTKTRRREGAKVAACSRRLKAVADQATPAEVTEGLGWYLRAERLAWHLSAQFCLSREEAAGILAVMSPSVSWAEQEAKTYGWLAAELEAPGHASFPGYPKNLEKARRILGGADVDTVVKGPKVTAFWRAICGDTQVVPIDRHALRAALGPYEPSGSSRGPKALRMSLTAGERRTVEAAYRNTAARCGLNPREFQAVVWVVQRRLTASSTEQKAN